MPGSPADELFDFEPEGNVKYVNSPVRGKLGRLGRAFD
jgi:hypothetical protein